MSATKSHLRDVVSKLQDIQNRITDLLVSPTFVSVVNAGTISKTNLLAASTNVQQEMSKAYQAIEAANN